MPSVTRVIRLTTLELVLTEAAVGLLQLDPDPASELDVPVPLPRVHLVLEQQNNPDPTSQRSFPKDPRFSGSTST